MHTGSPDSIHGRLLEAVHITGYTFERAFSELKWLLKDDRWKQVGPGYEDIDDFLKTIDLSTFSIAVEERKDLAKQLADLRSTRRATARLLGVSKGTIDNDVGQKWPKSKPVTQGGGIDVGQKWPTLEPASQEEAVAFVPNGTPTPPPSKPEELEEEGEEEMEQSWPSPPILATPAPAAIAHSGEQVAKDAERKAERAQVKSEESNMGDEWYTPRWIFKSLGIRFSMDVCAPQDRTYCAVPAEHYFTIDDNGLEQPWEGTVWCNPPYSTPEAWARKCIAHGDGMLLSHVPMNAIWCAEVWQTCDAIRLFQAIDFVRPSGELQRPGYWLQMAAWGEVATAALAQLTPPPEITVNPRRVPSPLWRAT